MPITTAVNGSSSGVTRRQFLRQGSTVVLALGAAPTLLAACGGGSATTGASPTTGTQSGPSQASGTVDFLSYEGYDLPDQLASWRKETGIEVHSTYIGAQDEIQAKLKSGAGKGVDLITYWEAYEPLYSALDILGPIDEDKIPNLAGLLPYFSSDVGNFWIDTNGNRVGVPFTWGVNGITYDAGATSEPTNWSDLFDAKLKGKVATVDYPLGQFHLTCRILDLDPSKCPKDRLPDVVDYLRRMLEQTKGLSASFGDMTTKLVSGDAVACYLGWAAMNNFALSAGKDTVKTNLAPSEGSISWCDAYAVPPESDNPEAAHAFINRTLDPKVSAAAAEFLVGGTTVAAAVGELDASTRDLYPYDDITGLFETSPFTLNPPVESADYVTFDEWSQSWQALKAGA
jgi:spermidine/putrescine transport system substrate-binding protein